jgi:hypothetical protein
MEKTIDSAEVLKKIETRLSLPKIGH